MFMVSPVPARKCAGRCGLKALPERKPGRASRHRCPNRTPERLVREIAQSSWRRRLEPAQIASHLGRSRRPSTQP